MIQIRIAVLLVLCISVNRIYAQQVMPLYPEGIPNATGYTMQEIRKGTAEEPVSYQKTSVPTMTVYLPETRNPQKTAVIIFPGGGYSALTFQREGTNTAKELVSQGIAAFVVKYRLPSDSIMKDKRIGPLQDAQTALKIVRMNAVKWGLDTNKIGAMGFSAGGHLVSTLGTHFTTSYIANPEHISLRPDFMILIYPVISMTDSLAHAGSRTNLLGANPPQEDILAFSNDQQVTDNTPPTYITQTEDDRTVSVENSIVFYEALLHHHVPAEMHLYPVGNHGFVLKLPIKEWTQPLLLWMHKSGWM